MKTNKLIIVASIFSTSLIFACAEAPKKEVEEEAIEVIEADEETVEEETAELMLPSPIQIAAMFNRSGLSYNAELPNSPEFVSNYNTKSKKYLNFGVYSADMAYAVLNEKQQAAIDYLAAIKTLSDETGMEAIFGSGDLINRFEKNIGTRDSVLRILTEIKIKTDSYLQENKEQSKSAVFFAGAWIEGMYLGIKSIDGNDMVKDRVLEQMNVVPGLIQALNTQSDESKEIAALTTNLEELNHFFTSNSTEDEDGYAMLSEENMTTLSSKINEIRTMIVSL